MGKRSFKKRRGFSYLILLPLFFPFLLLLQILLAGLVDEDSPADVALVLGSKVNEDGTPSRTLLSRLHTVIVKYREGRFPLILVSGGTGWEGYNEARFMRDYLVEQGGIPSESILVDPTGNNTFLTVKHFMEFREERRFESVYLITSHYHIYRTKMVLRRAGMERVSSAKGVPVFQWRDLYSLPREVIAILVYALQGRLRIELSL